MRPQAQIRRSGLGPGPHSDEPLGAKSSRHRGRVRPPTRSPDVGLVNESRENKPVVMSFKEAAIEVKDEVKEDNLVVAAAGLAFFGLLALVPTLLALVSIYGLVADPDDVQRQIEDLLESSPAEIRDFVSSQMQALAGSEATGLGLTVVLGILVALWGASSAVKHMMATLNQVHDLEETRGFVSVRGLSLLLTFGAILVLAGSVFLLGILPGLLSDVGLGSEGRYVLGVARFPLLLVLMVLSLAILYHIGPNWPEGRRFRFITRGAVLATLAWLVGSALFSIYTANIGRLNETYAATGGLVILLLFLFLTSFCVLLGAVIDEVVDRGSSDTSTTAADAKAAAPTPAPPASRPQAPAPGGASQAAIVGAIVGLVVGASLGRRR